MSTADRPSTGWRWINIGVIVVSIGVVLLPLATHDGLFRILFEAVVGPAYFIVLIRKARKTGLGDVPINQMAAEVRKGRRVRLDALEVAATIAFLLAVWNPFGS